MGSLFNLDQSNLNAYKSPPKSTRGRLSFCQTSGVNIVNSMQVISMN
jgi:hypothetical protein